MDEEARAAGINIIPDCGLAPGMVSVLAMHGLERFPEADSLHIRVGGLPKDPQPPLDYQIVFSVEGLINEYVEAARVVRDGKLITVESMTELETLDFPEPWGRMEAFQTSGGTSTLPQSLGTRIRNLDYKTIRYPGHCERFKAMLDLGLGRSEPVAIDGISIAPRRLFGKLLVDNLPADGPDVVLVRLSFMAGTEGRRRELRYQIIDEYDEENNVSAMMRTTAFPASIVAQMMANGETRRKGAIPQEQAIEPNAFVRELERRNIRIDQEMIT
ncbi:MAG: saccharopine dehydrogenase C-terminal domain-containing protein [Acidobacteriota bacterium]